MPSYRRSLRRVALAAAAASCFLAMLAVAGPAHAVSDRVLKRQMIHQLPGPRRVLLLGSSRMSKYHPRAVFGLSRLPTFNGAVSGGGTITAYCYLTNLAGRYPDHPLPQVVYGLDVEQFRPYPGEPEVLSDPAPCPYDPATAGPTQTTWLAFRFQRYDSFGYRAWDQYDRALQRGYTTTFLTRRNVAIYQKQFYYPGNFEHLSRQRLHNLEMLVKYANERGVAPTLFLTPMRPYAIRKLGPRGFWKRRAELRQHLDQLQASYDFTFYDFTYMRACGCRPEDHFDGVHNKRANGDRVIRLLHAAGALHDSWEPQVVTPEPMPRRTGRPLIYSEPSTE